MSTGHIRRGTRDRAWLRPRLPTYFGRLNAQPDYDEDATLDLSVIATDESIIELTLICDLL